MAEVIPAAAVEAAARLIATEVWRTPRTGDIAPEHLARAALEAAAPYMQRAEPFTFTFRKGVVGEWFK